MQSPKRIDVRLSRRHFLSGAASVAGCVLVAPACRAGLTPPGAPQGAAAAQGATERLAPGCPACCHPELARQCGQA